MRAAGPSAAKRLRECPGDGEWVCLSVCMLLEADEKGETIVESGYIQKQAS